MKPVNALALIALPLSGSLGIPASTAAVQTSVAIDHKPVGCVVAERFPGFEARLNPGDSVAAARVLFQGSGSSEWFWVAMKPEAGVFRGVLPKPKRELKAFRYYIEATDRAMNVTRTAEAEARVVGSNAECASGITALGLSVASVILQGPAAVIPAGFMPTGVVMAGASTAVGAAGAGAAGGASGGSTGLVLGGVAVAGGAVAVAAKGGDGAGTPSTSTAPVVPAAQPQPTPAPTPVAQYSLSFTPQMDVSACAGRSLVWGSQAVGSLDSGGNFDITWSPNEPNTLRITGTAAATTFQARLACVNGAATGAVNATGSSTSYSGTYQLGSSSGQVTITSVR